MLEIGACDPVRIAGANQLKIVICERIIVNLALNAYLGRIEGSPIEFAGDCCGGVESIKIGT
jgi:hypothetical protein